MDEHVVNKMQTKSWEEAHEEVARVASPEDCKAIDQAIAAGRKVTAVKLLRCFGISVYAD